MGKLHKIRKAFEQLPEKKKQSLSRGFHDYYGVIFDKNGRAEIKWHKDGKKKYSQYLKLLLIRNGYMEKVAWSKPHWQWKTGKTLAE